MVEQTIELIRRVQAILGVRSDFFDAVCEWYSDVSLARKAVKLLVSRSSAGARVSLTVNGHLLAGEAVTVTPQARNLTWVLAPGVVAPGDNEIALYVEKTSGQPLSAQAVSAFQEGLLPRQTVDLSCASPTPAAHLELVTFGGARHCGDGWELKAGGYLTFRLRLRAPAPVTFSLVLPGGDEDGWLDDLKDVLEDIQKRVEEMRCQLEEERRRVGRSDPARAARLQSQVADLIAYGRLQQVQIEPAFHGGDNITMQDVIRRTGDPDWLIAQYQPPRASLPVQPVRPVAPATPAPAFTPVRSAPRPAPKSSCASSCLGVLLVGALIVGGLAYYCWNYLIPKPAVRFDSLGEGQTVAAGAPLQVWVSGEDLLGVESLSLSVESGGENLVEGSTNPAKVTFPPNTMNTGTKVFTLNLKPYAGPEARSITLVAAMASKRGAFTARRVLKIGGKEQSLVYELNPPEPKAGQNVQVIIHAVNAPPGAKVAYTLQGTDNYHLEGTLDVGPDGTVRYEVLGGASGVRDDLDARIDGTAVRQTVSYRFGD